MMLSVFILAVSALTTDGESLDTIRVFDASYAKDLAEGAHLPALSPVQDEVRVWSEAAFFDATSGWVLTKSEVRFYSNARDSNKHPEANQGQWRLERTVRNGRKASALLSKFARLSALDGKSYTCGFDGSAYAIEGMVHGQHFSFSAINPGFCQEAEARRVARLVSELVRVVRSAP